MYRFSFVESVSGKAREVSRQLFHEIISREDIKRKCKQIADIVNTPQEQENSKNEALSLKGRRLLKKSTGTHNLSFLRVFMLLKICVSQYFFVSLLSQIMIVKCLKANKNCN